MRLSLLFGLCLSTTNALQDAFHEKASVPSGWRRLPGVPSGNLTLRVGLRLENLNVLESRLYQTSNPQGDAYGKHLKGQEVRSLVRASASSKRSVAKWLEDRGAIVHYADDDWVTFGTTVEQANQLLKADFAYYENEDGVKKLRTTHYAVPHGLSEHVDLIHPTTYFGQTRAHAPAPRNQIYKQPIAGGALTADTSCASLITPDCLRELYDVHYTPDPTYGSRIAFANYLNQSARYEDLAIFERTFNIPPQNISKVTLLNGGIDNQTMDKQDRAEANLDVQTIIGLSHPLPVTAYITGGSPPFIPNLDEPVLDTNEPYLEFYTYLLAQPDADLPQVISSSYGDDEQTVPPRYARRVCNQIMQLTARGVTMVVSSGDTGVGAACRANDGSNATQFTPQFPATCPFVTAVGGTQSYKPEVAWVGSGGGFSNYFDRPGYQSQAVKNYLDTEVSAETKAYYQPYVNFQGRGFPDVAAHSDSPRFSIVLNNQLARIAGTSAAAPVVAAIVALVNDARLRQGKPVLGFINPWLYAGGYAVFNDITGGESTGCDGTNQQTGDPVLGGGVIPGASWNATQGWDPVTGWGTPDFGKWKDAD